MKVSVCVPAFERVEYLARLIASVRCQNHTDWEICVSDDSRDDSVQRFVATLKEDRVYYARNPGRRGLGPNLRHALAMANGEVAIVLGDDDVLSCSDALACYAEAARRHSTARFFYANQLQIDVHDEVTLTHRYFDQDRYYEPGRPSFATTWLRSVQIAGMCFRLGDDGVTPALVPEEPCLFPQVEAVGHLVARWGSVALARYLVSPRGHPMQLGGQAAQGKLVSSPLEQQGAAELLRMVRSFAAQYPSEVGPLAKTLERHIVVNFAGSMPNLRLTAGLPALRRLTGLVMGESPCARRAWWLWGLYLGLLMTPTPALQGLVRVLKRGQVALRPSTTAGVAQADLLGGRLRTTWPASTAGAGPR